MSTSGTSTFTMTRDQICQQALILLGVYTQTDVTQGTINSSDITFVAQALNMMVKAWEGQGIHLWTNQEAAIFFTVGQQYYNLTSSGDIAGDDVVFTTSTVTETGGTSLPVTSTIGMNVNDNIGLVLDNNTIQWTTIQSINTSTNILTLNASITSQASAGNNVFVFTNRVNLPLAVQSVRFLSSSGYERPVAIRGRDDFMSVPNKTQQAPANQCYFSNRINDARFYVWPTADDVADCLRITYSRKIQDFVSSSDNPDLPQEWLEPIVYNLAIRIAPSYGISIDKLNPDIKEVAQESLVQLQIWDSEPGGLRVNQNYNWYED